MSGHAWSAGGAPTHAPEEARRFFQALWPGHLPATLRTPSWTKNTGRMVTDSSRRPEDLHELLESSQTNAGGAKFNASADHYFHVAAHHWASRRDQEAREARGAGRLERPNERIRGTAASAELLPAVWVDLDTAEGDHRGTGLPTRDEALAALDELEPSPSCIVDSGGGLHAYWFLDQPLSLASPDLRSDAEALLKALATALRGDLAATSLAQVLRIPGSVNWKPKTRRRSKILRLHPELRYSFAELRDWMQEQPAQQVAKEVRKIAQSQVSTADAHRIEGECEWMRHCKADAAHLPEPEWYAALSILAHCKNSQDRATEWSADYPDYEPKKTIQKLQQAKESAGPRTCNWIIKNVASPPCKSCKHFGKVTSPIQLGTPNGTEKCLATIRNALQEEDPHLALLSDDVLRATRTAQLRCAPEYARIEPQLKAVLKKANCSLTSWSNAVRASDIIASEEGLRLRKGNDAETSDGGPISLLVPGDHVGLQGNEIVIPEFQFAADAIESIPRAEIYRRGVSGHILVGTIDTSNGSARASFTPMDVSTGKLLLSRHARPISRRVVARTKEVVTKTVPWRRPDVELIFAEAKTNPGIRHLSHLNTYPSFMGVDFELSAPGWNEDFGVYYDCPTELVGLEPERSSPSELELFFREVLIDFPFKDVTSDLPNFIGLLLTLLVRPAFEGPTPFFLCEANQPRVGKSLLMSQVAGDLILGSRPPSIQLKPERDEAENEKRIGTILSSGVPYALFDNINHTIDSAALASALTTDPFSFRRFGTHDLVECPNNTILGGTLNNAECSQEMSNRVVPIQLYSEHDNPSERSDMKHQHLRAYLRRNRRPFIAILAGMVETWKLAGKPGCRHRMGSFEEWAETVGGIMYANGFDAFLSNRRSYANKVNPQAVEDEALIRELDRRHPHSASFTATQALTAAESLNIDTKTNPQNRERIRAAQYARVSLKHLIDVPRAGLVLRKRLSGNNSTYYVESLSPSDEGPSGNRTASGGSAEPRTASQSGTNGTYGTSGQPLTQDEETGEARTTPRSSDSRVGVDREVPRPVGPARPTQPDDEEAK